MAIAGPVPAGTAQAFPEGITVALVLPDGELAEADRKEISGRISHGLGNDCAVVSARSLDEALELLPEEGRRQIRAA